MSLIDTQKAFVLEDYTTLSIDGSIYNPGYVFVGWNTRPDGSGIAVQADALYSPSADVSLYAQWEKRESSARVTVYTWNDDYNTTFIQPDGSQQITTSQDNSIVFTQIGQAGQLKITSPGVMIAPKNGETISGLTSYVNTDTSIETKTIKFTIGEFSQLTISKIPIDYLLSVDGKMHVITHEYSSVGTVFGGHHYKVHWYDDVIFSPDADHLQGHTTTSSDYVFNRNDMAFVNVAHKGGKTSHIMHLSCGYYDYQTQNITTIAVFDRLTGLHQSKPDVLKNFYTCKFNEFELDLRSQPLSNMYFIGYSIKDYNDECAGIKFRGKYRLYIDEE